MSVAGAFDSILTRARRGRPQRSQTRVSAGRFGAFFAVLLRVQNAPWECMASSCLFAMTRLARPNKVKSCASFFANPL